MSLRRRLDRIEAKVSVTDLLVFSVDESWTVEQHREALAALRTVTGADEKTEVWQVGSNGTDPGTGCLIQDMGELFEYVAKKGRRVGALEART